ncbi:hypothetical protein [Salinivibrio sp. IB282]|uniref:hypothetical protein n=1 Tax=Salinivibrio sp. IB282 TaxID=1766122 RepID=UPI003FD6B3CF
MTHPKSAKQTARWQLITLTLIAALMGIGQNGLLVSLPLLVAQSGFSLSTWAVIIAVGSVLFLPAAPFWDGSATNMVLSLWSCKH